MRRKVRFIFKMFLEPTDRSDLGVVEFGQILFKHDQ